MALTRAARRVPGGVSMRRWRSPGCTRWRSATRRETPPLCDRAAFSPPPGAASPPGLRAGTAISRSSAPEESTRSAGRTARRRSMCRPGRDPTTPSPRRRLSSRSLQCRRQTARRATHQTAHPSRSRSHSTRRRCASSVRCRRGAHQHGVEDDAQRDPENRPLDRSGSHILIPACARAANAL